MCDAATDFSNELLHILNPLTSISDLNIKM